MKKFDLSRPDRLILSGIRSLGDLTLNLYSDEKNRARNSGDVTFIGSQKIDKVYTQLYKYDKDEMVVQSGIKDFSVLKMGESPKIDWLNIYGLHDVELIKKFSTSLNLDRLTLMQILDTTLRPKVEEYDHYLFFSIKSILKDSQSDLKVEQLSFVLTENSLTSLQEEEGDHFDHIRNKIEEGLGMLRKKGADYLLYQLLDAILDNYFETIEKINTELTLFEKDIIQNPKQEDLVKLENAKRLSEIIKKSLHPVKEAIRIITNRKSKFINEENMKFFSDLMNSCLGVLDEVDATLKSLEGLTNIYFSSLSQKMNETMKVLTLVATIFIPLTFIAGIYGMNFEYMPELHYRYGYFYVWGFMGLIMVAMVIYFKRKKWL